MEAVEVGGEIPIDRLVVADGVLRADDAGELRLRREQAGNGERGVGADGRAKGSVGKVVGGLGNLVGVARTGGVGGEVEGNRGEIDVGEVGPDLAVFDGGFKILPAGVVVRVG